MKKTTLVITILMSLFALNIHAQCGESAINTAKPISIGIVIYSNDIETVWNALRLANFSKNEGDTVSIFLLGKGVEVDTLSKTNKDIKEQVESLLENGTVILGCGTCLQSRKNNDPKACKFSSMADLYNIIRKNKIVLTF